MALASRTAIGHVAPAVKENNRYIKVTVFPDRVRVAYVIYYGEIPGQRARQEIDRNGDDLISESETEALAAVWMRRVERATSVTLGGQGTDLHWQTADVGIDDPSVTGGAFSIDLVGWVCIGEHPRELVFKDELKLDDPGETEVLPEESPGTEIQRLRLGDRTEPTLRWDGGAGPLPRGLVIAWTSEEDSQSQTCRDLVQRDNRSRAWPLALALAGLALALAAALWIWRRRRSTEAPDEPS